MLYAIVDQSGGTDLTKYLSTIPGVNHSGLYGVIHKGLTAVLEKMNNSGIIVNTENALRYSKIIEELHHQYDLLPVRYGTLMKTDEEVIAMLEKHGQDLMENLERVKNREEFSLKIFWDYEKGREAVRKYLKENDLQNEASFAGKTETAIYLLKKIEAYRFENALQDYAERLCEEIRQLTDPLCPQIKFKKMASKPVLLDVVFLLAKGQKKEFVRIIDRINDLHKDFRFLLTGPWPPYSFAVMT